MEIGTKAIATTPIQRRDVVVGGTRTHYYTGGHGPAVVLLHGCGLAGGTYLDPLVELAKAGVRVYAPTMPGFGRADSLPRGRDGLADFGRWVTDFLDKVGLYGPVTVVGHSFGGGVAIRLAHDRPERVARLILVNSVGGSAWCNSAGKLVPMHERSLLEWAQGFRSDSFGTRDGARTLSVALRDLLPNLLTNAVAVWRSANLARSLDLAAELAVLSARGTPTSILSSDDDRVIPRASIDAMRRACTHARSIVVKGNHSWPLVHPGQFAELVSREMTFVASAA